ncbi:MAG: hypothetical protein ACHQIO_08045 [Nevskiales bacterium]
MRVITKAPARITKATIDAAWRLRGGNTRLIVRDKDCRWPEQVRAMDLWGRLLAQAITGEGAPANVVPLTARAV